MSLFLLLLSSRSVFSLRLFCFLLFHPCAANLGLAIIAFSFSLPPLRLVERGKKSRNSSDDPTTVEKKGMKGGGETDGEALHPSFLDLHAG